MSFRLFLRIIQARQKIVLAAVLIFLGTALLTGAIMPKKYTATSQLVVSAKLPKTEDNAPLPEPLPADVVSTQMDLIYSDAVLQEAISQLKLNEDPQLHAMWQKKWHGKGDYGQFAMDWLRKGLVMTQVQKRNIFKLDYSASTPDAAIQFNNAILDSYIRVSARIKARQYDQYIASLQDSIRQQKVSLDEARMKLLSYESENLYMVHDAKARLAALTQSQSVRNQRLVNERRQEATVLNEFENERIALRSRQLALNKIFQDEAPLLELDNSRITDLIGRLNKAREHQQEFDTIIDIDTAWLQQLNSQLARVEVEQARLHGVDNVAQQPESSDEINVNPAVQSLKTEVITLQGKLHELANQYGENYPLYQKTKRQLQTQEVALQQQMSHLKQSMNTSRQGMDDLAAQLKQAITAHKARMQAFHQVRDNYSRLNKELKDSERDDALLQQRLLSAKLEGAPQSGDGAVLARAVAPIEAKNPGIFLIGVLSLPVGIFFGLCLALLNELLERRVRLVSDIQQSLKTNVLATLNSSNGLLSSAGKIDKEILTNDDDARVEPSASQQNSTYQADYRDDRIGQTLLEAGRLQEADLKRVIDYQATHRMRFGEVAILLGILTQQDIDFALSQQYGHTWFSKADRNLSQFLITAFHPVSKQAEQFRDLRSQVQVSWLKSQPTNKALAILSADRNEGRSYIAANLAISFSQLGKQTLLIDADFINPCQHILFKLENLRGLSQVLSGKAGVDVVEQIEGLPYLSVMTAGKLFEGSYNLLKEDRFVKLLQEANKVFDIIIIDTMSSRSGMEGQIVANLCGQSILISKQDTSLLVQQKELARSLRESGAQVLGTVINEYDHA
ncbi:polysaccharide biosynthesis tyrosine autokinase [Ampullimonas aquatilis]|uniref:polysaccharide biosynthesis tyrosine autokinase n=1 Tax=Ampullimonas aquatilis TaxID=1341549 RepID=UPI003C770257